MRQRTTRQPRSIHEQPRWQHSASAWYAHSSRTHAPALTPSRAQSESAKANRKDLIAETSTTRANARNAVKLERKRKQAEAMGEKAEARDTGEDLERKRAWEYSIEDNERWDKKMARKGRRADFTFTGPFCSPWAHGRCD